MPHEESLHSEPSNDSKIAATFDLIEMEARQLEIKSLQRRARLVQEERVVLLRFGEDA